MNNNERLQSGEIDEAVFREIMAGKVITFFERTEIFEKCQELLQPENQGEILSFEEFKDFIIRINGLIRDIPIGDREADGENAVLRCSLFDVHLPKQKDKEYLLLKTYEALPSVDKKELQYFIPLMITAIHLFKDANGRTSRIFNLLLSKFDSKQDFLSELKMVSIEHSIFTSVDVNPKSIRKHTQSIILAKYIHDMNDDTLRACRRLIVTGNRELFKPNTYKFLDIWFIDSDICLSAILIYFREKGHDDSLQKCIVKYNYEEDDGSPAQEKVISLEELNKILNNDDWQNVIDIYYSLKKEEVEVMIDIFINPDDYHINDNMSLPTVKDILIAKSKNK